MAIEKKRITLKETERIDQLLWKNLQMIQNPGWFCFGLDAVLLSDFAEILRGEQGLDLCTGGGVIPLLLSAKAEETLLTGIELFPEVAEMAERSVLLNDLASRIKILTGDICCLPEVEARTGMALSHRFQVVTVNPPYRKKNQGRLSPCPLVAAAKAEVYCDLTQVAAAIAATMTQTGRFYLVYPYERLGELLTVLEEKQLQVTRLRLVKMFAEKEPALCLVGGGFNKSPCNLPEKISLVEYFTVFQAESVYTQEMQAIFEKYREE